MVEFVLSAWLVVRFAGKLTKYADALEKKTDISAVWIGTICLAIVTSLPEAVTTIGAALLEGALNLGVGNLCGSNTFNLLILVVLDLLRGRTPLLLGVQSGLVVAAGGGVIMMALVAVATGFHQAVAADEGGGWTGPIMSVVIFVAYFLMSHLSSRELPISDTSQPVVPAGPAQVYRYTVDRIVKKLVFYAVTLILVAVWLLFVCDALARTPITIGKWNFVLGHTVTGSFLLSAATSFPEFFVCMAALRLGQTNMAVANLLGSNMVNMAFIPVMHLFVWDAGFYGQLAGAPILVLLCTGMLMSTVFIVGVLARSKRSYFLLGWDTVSILVIYIAGAIMVLRLGLKL